MTTTIDLASLRLEHGAHKRRTEGVCLLEAAAWLAGKPHSDHPPCVSPVLGSFGRSFNDYLPDEPRQQLVPFIPRLLDTAGDGLDAARLDTMTRWMAHYYAPRWLELAGLTDQAVKLRALVIPQWPDATADATADADAADAATADAATAAATATAATADARQLRQIIYSCRSVGYRAARVIAFRAVKDFRDYGSAREAARAALAPAVAEFQAAGIELFDNVINPSANKIKEEATA